MNENLDFAEEAELLSLLANEKRLLIAFYILHEELSVRELAERVGLSQSALSQHLARFREAGVVDTRRDAQSIYYSTAHRGIRRIVQAVREIYEPSYKVSSKKR